MNYFKKNPQKTQKKSSLGWVWVYSWINIWVEFMYECLTGIRFEYSQSKLNMANGQVRSGFNEHKKYIS